MTVTYNRSENAAREFRVLGRRSEMGRSRVEIECPFCGTRFWAFIWSISGGGKRCENVACGAMHGSTGSAWPVVGREDFTPETAPRKFKPAAGFGRPARRKDYAR